MIAFRAIADADVEAVAALWRACGLTRAWNDPVKDIAFARAGQISTILVGEAEGAIAVSVMVGHDGHRGMLYYVPRLAQGGGARLLREARPRDQSRPVHGAEDRVK